MKRGSFTALCGFRTHPAVGHLMRNDRRLGAIALRESAPLFQQLLSSLSRACLGKPMIASFFIQRGKLDNKVSVSAPPAASG